MSRLVWVGVGAAGGIWAYRRSQRSWERAKERGVAGNTAAITRTVADVYRGIRDAEKPELLDITAAVTTTRLTPGDPTGRTPEGADPDYARSPRS